MKQFFIVFSATLIILIAGSVYIIKVNNSEKLTEPQIISQVLTPTSEKIAPTPTPTLSPTPTIAIRTKVLIENVPFAPQAPFAEWKDERFQDGCEEAVSAMAVYWAKGLSLDKAKMREEIIAMSAYQTEKYQEFRDTSAKDSAERLIKGYFNYQNYEIKENISLNDIKIELLKGNLVIIPTNGQALNNPHFTQPGPERHNLIVRGFDDERNIFITNDPGIKEGELYQYPQQVLFDAIRDYPTGYHQPITEIKKIMIIVKKP